MKWQHWLHDCPSKYVATTNWNYYLWHHWVYYIWYLNHNIFLPKFFLLQLWLTTWWLCIDIDIWTQYLFLSFHTSKIFLSCRCGSQRGGGGWRCGETALRDQPEQSWGSHKARSLVPSSISEALLHVSRSPIWEVKIVISFFYFRCFPMI